MKKKKEPKIYKPILDKSKSGERYRCQIIYYVKDIQKKTWGDRCDTPEEAIKNAEMKLERLVNDIEIRPLHYTVAEVANKFIEDKLNLPQFNSPSTIESDISNVRSAIFCDKTKYQYTSNAFRNIKMSELSSNMLNRWLNDLANYALQGKISKNRYKKLKSAMRKLIEYANNTDCFKDYKDYSDLVSVLNNKTVYIRDDLCNRDTDRAKRIITREQFKKMTANETYFKNGQYPMRDEILIYHEKYKKFFMDSVYYHLFSILFYTGIRMSEARSLRLSDIDIDIQKTPKCKIFITKSLAYKYPKGKRDEFKSSLGNPTKTKNSTRIVFIKNSYVNNLDDYLSYLDCIYEDAGIEDGLLFPNHKFEYLSDHAVDSKLETWLKKLGDDRPKKFSKHDFRRTRATIMLNNGKSSNDLKEYFGHSIKDIIDDYYDARNAEDKYKIADQNIDETNFDAEEVQSEQLEVFYKRTQKSLSK